MILLLVFVAASCALAVTTVDVTVDWTSSGDHGMTGIAAENDLRIIDMTETGLDSSAVHARFLTLWGTQPWVPNVPNPVEPGTVQVFTFHDFSPNAVPLVPGHTYAISMKVRNHDGLWSALGNIAIFTTPEPTGPPDPVNVTVKVMVTVEVNTP